MNKYLDSMSIDSLFSSCPTKFRSDSTVLLFEWNSRIHFFVESASHCLRSGVRRWITYSRAIRWKIYKQIKECNTIQVIYITWYAGNCHGNFGYAMTVIYPYQVTYISQIKCLLFFFNFYILHKLLYSSFKCLHNVLACLPPVVHLLYKGFQTIL